MSEESLVNLNAEAAPEEEASEVNSQEASDVSDNSGDGGEQLLAGKYKTPEDLEKGYKELSAKLREKLPEPPEKYEFSNEGIEGFEDVEIDADDPRLEHFQGVFKELGLTNEQANRLALEQAKMEAEHRIDPEAERAKLGENADKVIAEVEQFFAKNVKSLGLTDGEREELLALSATADGVRAINKLVRRIGGQTVPENAKPSQPDANELMQKAQDLRKSSDFDMRPEKKSEYNKLMEQYAQLKLAGKG